jgi:hypothetical protein
MHRARIAGHKVPVLAAQKLLPARAACLPNDGLFYVSLSHQITKRRRPLIFYHKFALRNKTF